MSDKKYTDLGAEIFPCNKCGKITVLKFSECPDCRGRVEIGKQITWAIPDADKSLKMTRYDFNKKVTGYRACHETGHYCNPHYIAEDLEQIISQIPDLSEEEILELEDIAHDTGMLFWDW